MAWILVLISEFRFLIGSFLAWKQGPRLLLNPFTPSSSLPATALAIERQALSHHPMCSLALSTLLCPLGQLHGPPACDTH